MRLHPLHLALLALCCCASPRTMRVRPVAARDLREVVFLSFAASQVDGFFDAQGHPCPPFNGRILDFFAGWQSHDAEPICDHDTFDDGPHPASLELRFRGSVPADGALDLVSGGYAVGAFGRAVARGSHIGDYFAWARVTLEVESEHCRGSWSSPIAKATVTGIFSRQTEFSGWSEVPDVHLSGCKAGDPLEVKLRLASDSNRGRIEVEAFGFSASAADELNRIFGLRRAAPTPRSVPGALQSR